MEKCMRVVIFGTGRFYKNRKAEIDVFCNNIEIVAFLDNNQDVREMDGKKVLLPENVKMLEYDKIVLMSVYAGEMFEQLLNCGVDREKIISWTQFRAHALIGKRQVYMPQRQYDFGKRILIISTDLGYNGGTMAAVYVARALLMRGYYVCLCAPNAGEKCIEEFVSIGIEIVIYPAILAMEGAEMQWVMQFDFVFVNVFQMMVCACEISKVKPVLWWIHEYRFGNLFEDTKRDFWNYDDINKMKDINVVAVSNIAKKNFEEFYPRVIKHIMPLAIPDDGYKETVSGKKPIVFAIEGWVQTLKGQLDFLKAVEMIPDRFRVNCEFWIIGHIGNDGYSREVLEYVDRLGSVKVIGELNREQMHKAYEKIDVVVCASLEETMSIAIVEGLMKGNVCITTDATGIAEYITDGVNGYICEAGNIESLSNKLQYVIENFEGLNDVRHIARETYEKHFSLEIFGERLEEEMDYTNLKWSGE